MHEELLGLGISFKNILNDLNWAGLVLFGTVGVGKDFAGSGMEHADSLVIDTRLFCLVSPTCFMKTIRKVSVCGLGKLGACIAATAAARGFEVLGADLDPEKVRRVNEGLLPVEEPLLAETIAAGRARLRATLDH